VILSCTGLMAMVFEVAEVNPQGPAIHLSTAASGIFAIDRF
jgi:hypothetical protein